MNATAEPKSILAPRPRAELRLARVWGMDSEARASIRALEQLAGKSRIGVAGRFMADSGISRRLSEIGVPENVGEGEFHHFSHMVIPFCGVTSTVRRALEESGVEISDMTSESVRRAQVALGLLRMEGARTLVIGRHEDPESIALAGGPGGARIIEETTDTARLGFYPAFGAVCQSTLSPQRIHWLVQQLRLRFRDARVTFLDTTAPGMAARSKALDELLGWCDSVVVVGDGGEASCEALAEAALRRGKPALIAATPAALETPDFTGSRRIALTAGAFATDHAVRAIATTLLGR